MNKRTQAIVVAAVVIGTLGFVAYGMLTLFVDPYVSVDAVVENPDAYMNRKIQLKGNYLANSLAITSDNVTLVMYGEQYNITVVITGEVPNLQADQELVAIGFLQSAKVIIAEEILAQCPSKYETNSTTTTG